MRQPIFIGLRPDKDPKACVREVPQATEKLKEEAVAEAVEAEEKPKTSRSRTARDKVVEPSAGPALTHPDKVLWPADGFTKRDLAEYYRAVAPVLLPHLKDRPLILKRYPNMVHAIEVWNEVNLDREWTTAPQKLDPARYVTLLTVAHDAIKAADPLRQRLAFRTRQGGQDKIAMCREGRQIAGRERLTESLSGDAQRVRRASRNAGDPEGEPTGTECRRRLAKHPPPMVGG